MLNLSTLPFSSRRSHLDSFSYRTLVQIFSHCNLQQPNNNDESSSPHPNPNPNNSVTDDVDEAETSFDAARIEKGVCQVADTLIKELDLDDDDDDGCFDIGLLEGIMTDCTKLIEETVGIGDLDEGEKKQEKNDKVAVEAEARKGPGEEMNISCDNGMRNEEREDMAGLEKFTEAQLMRELGERTQQEMSISPDNLIACNNQEFEEGEIPDDFENLDQSLELVNEPEGAEEKKPGDGLVSKGCEKSGNLNADNFDGRSWVGEKFCNVSDSTLMCFSQNQELKCFRGDEDLQTGKGNTDTFGFSGENPMSSANMKPCGNEVVEVQVKKKYKVLTEGRKAKRKIAKKRKRAQKEREQGVKRLKLQPIVKPKEVKYCHFFMMGRCQQGDSCKFSHDTTPLTKSQPCKHFSRDQCLKGDDCPFDHELSKYPCHKFMQEGNCIRGDRCKFSHKLPAADTSSSPASAVVKDSLGSSGKLNSMKQFHLNRTIDQSKSATTPSVQFKIMQKPLAGNLTTAPKEPKVVPNGIHFLSFGNTNKQQGNQQKQEKLLAARPQNFSSMSHKTVPSMQSEKNMSSTPMYTVAGTSTTSVCTNSSTKSLQTEAAEASKLLEEFLFCG